MINKLSRRINILQAEIFRKFILLKRYFVNSISDLIVTFLIFTAIFLGGKTIELSPQEISLKIIGILIAFIAILGVQFLFKQIKEENELGTMEQLFLLPIRFINIFSIRFIIEIMVFLIKLLLMTILFFYISGLAISIGWVKISLVSVIIAPGMLGFGLIFGGASFIFKRVSNLQNLFSLLLFPVSLVNFTSEVPLEGVTEYFPYTLGLKIVQTLVKEAWTWEKLITSSQIHLLLIVSLVYFVSGLLIYRWFKKQALVYGSLGKY